MLPLIGLCASLVIAMLGNTISALALPWFVLELTGSASETGLTAFVGAVPMVLGLLFGGTLVDRLGYRRSSIIADLASFLAVAAVPLLHLTIGLEFWQLLVLVFLGALLDSPGSTAREALLPSVAKAAGLPLERVNAVFESIQGLIFLLGPVLAGLLVMLLGPVQALWVNAATFVIAALLIVVLVPRHIGQAPPQTQRYFAAWREGLRFLWHERLLRALTGISTLFVLLIAPISVVMPVYMQRTYGSALDLGLFLSATGAGSIVGALLYAWLAPRLPAWVTPRRLLLVGLYGIALSFAVIALLPPLAVLLAASFVQGLVSGPINPLVATAMQQRTPENMRGRVLGMMGGLAMISSPLGFLLAGFLVDVLGVQAVLIGITGGFALVALATLFIPALHELDAKHERDQFQV
jgi:MFS family permease